MILIEYYVIKILFFTEIGSLGLGYHLFKFLNLFLEFGDGDSIVFTFLLFFLRNANTQNITDAILPKILHVLVFVGAGIVGGVMHFGRRPCLIEGILHF